MINSKVNLAVHYNRHEEYQSQSRETNRDEQSKVNKFKELLNQKIVPTD